jgi:hypothetical protein
VHGDYQRGYQQGYAQGVQHEQERRQEALHQFPCGHFGWRIRRGDGSLMPPPDAEECVPCRERRAALERADAAEALAASRLAEIERLQQQLRTGLGSHPCEQCFNVAWDPIENESSCVLKHPHDGPHMACGHCALYEAFRIERDRAEAAERQLREATADAYREIAKELDRIINVYAGRLDPTGMRAAAYEEIILWLRTQAAALLREREPSESAQLD